MRTRVLRASAHVLIVMGALFAVAINLDAQQEIRRLAALYKHFDFSRAETAALATDRGIVVVQRSVMVPPDANTLYVTISATGNTHDGAALWLECEIERSGVGALPCNTGQATGTPNPVTSGGPFALGWIALQKHFVHAPWNFPLIVIGDGGGGGGDMHSNGLHYSWCTPATGGETVTIYVRMASSGSDDETNSPFFEPDVHLEGIHFYIDASGIANPADRCTQAPW